MSNKQGAVCNINTGLQPNQPQIPPYPAIPLANDLASALQAINALRNIVQGLLNQVGSLYPSINGSPGRQGQPGQNANSNAGGNFQEVPGSRQTQTVKVTNPDDAEQYVTVEIITGVSFKNSAGQTLVWNSGS